jgi:hypothetical protein
MSAVWVKEAANSLAASGLTRTIGSFARPDYAFSAAQQIVGDAAGTGTAMMVIGDFVLPPPGGPPSRDFQTLHLDFGLPLIPKVPADVAQYTALHVAADMPPSAAITRFVPLNALLGGRPWPDRAELIHRFAAYGASHGAWDDTAGYIEGSLARIVEAGFGQPPVLPSVKAHPQFLCGTEFSELADELQFFTDLGLRLNCLEIEVCLLPGELVVFDNLAFAHGRRGTPTRRTSPAGLRSSSTFCS